LVCFLSCGERYQLDALPMLLDACHYASGKFECGTACSAIHTRLLAGAYAIDKGLELGTQRLNVRRGQLLKCELRLRAGFFY
jgi:hypothetical protein